MTVYTDGLYLHNGLVDAKARARLWFRREDACNKAIKLPEGLPQFNNTGKVLAILCTIMIAPKDEPLKILSDSKN